MATTESLRERLAREFALKDAGLPHDLEKALPATPQWRARLRGPTWSLEAAHARAAAKLYQLDHAV